MKEEILEMTFKNIRDYIHSVPKDKEINCVISLEKYNKDMQEQENERNRCC